MECCGHGWFRAYAFVDALRYFDVNYGPLSVTISLGVPCSLTMLQMYNVAAPLADRVLWHVVK